MSEKRKKSATILIKTEANAGKTSVKVELFPAAQWERERDCLFRLRVNGAWVNNEQSIYYSVGAVNEYLAGLMKEVFDEAGVSQSGRREVHALDPCWLDYGPDDHDLGIPLRSCQARVVSNDSVIGMDGRQYVVVSSVEIGTRLMAVDDLRFYDGKKTKERKGGR